MDQFMEMCLYLYQTVILPKSMIKQKEIDIVL